MEKPKIIQAILVEGKYDGAKLSSLVDALILTTGGFDIYKDKEKKALLKELARRQGLVILTDSDAAGFRIRNYVTNLVGAEYVYQAYVPSIRGKESRKAVPGKEGLLGVEGVDGKWILKALEPLITQVPEPEGRAITYGDLYDWGISGKADSAQARREFCRRLALPLRLSKKELVEVLNRLYSWEELDRLLRNEQSGPPAKPGACVSPRRA